MTRCSLIPLCLSFFIVSGCRTTSLLKLSEHPVSWSEVQEVTRGHHERIHSMSGEGQISLETPEIAQSGSFILTLQKPDSVLIQLRGPFGIKVGSALVTRTEFLFYNSLENKLITGLSSTENLNRILHIQLSFNDLVSLFAGGSFLESDSHAPDDTKIEDDQYIFEFYDEMSSRRYWVDPTSLLIQKVQFLDQSRKVALEQTFGKFEDTDGFAMPYAICIVQPRTHQRLTITYSEIRVNTEKLHFTFIIPQNAERIHW
jgi:outer membrane lipoprotein-sorting protein